MVVISAQVARPDDMRMHDIGMIVDPLAVYTVPTAITIRVSGAECFKVPAVPVTVTVYVPGAVPDEPCETIPVPPAQPDRNKRAVTKNVNPINKAPFFLRRNTLTTKPSTPRN